MTLQRFIPGLFLVFLSAAPAQAGFEWTPPVAAAPARIEGTQSAGPLMPVIPAIAVEAIGLEEPGTPPEEPVLSETAVNTVAPSGAVFAEAIGFGSDMPLVLALRQVVPPRYAFAFDPAVDQGARVSWNGGKPWNLVLDDALKPLGLAAIITETTVRIAPASTAPAVASAPVPVFVPAPVQPAETAAPQTILPVEDQADDNATVQKELVREVYIRRNGETSRVDESSTGIDETLSPAAGSPVPEDERPSFWNRLGFSAEQPEQDSPPQPMQAPLLTAPEGESIKESVLHPVSLSGGTEMRPPSATVKAAKHQGVMDPYDVRFWEAEKGDSLKNVLATWSDTAGVELYWVAAEDYILPEEIRLHGNYTEALTRILAVYGDVAQRPQGRLHPNLPTGPSVLIIEAAQN